tara:strand:- start:2601 stop:4229 length:1629 start_codon:yes stop_codon:yes gene_type:complete
MGLLALFISSKMSSQSHNQAISDLLPDTIIELYEVELGGSDGIKRFHAGKIIEKDIVLSEVIEQSGGNTIKVPHTYFAIPFEVDGFESRGDGQLPRPKLIVANPKGVITDLIKRRDDLVGSLFKRVRIFLKYIDEENFPEGINPFATSDPSSRFDDDVYVFNRKVTENKYFIEFELVSPLEMENAKLPARTMIANYCPWHYRGIGCRYGQRRGGKGGMLGPVALSKQGAAYFLEESAAAGQSDEENLAANLGIVVADENDKEFIGSGGYDLGRLNWAYDYDHSGFTTVITGSSANDEATSINVGATVKIDNVGGYVAGDYTLSGLTVDATSRIIYAGQTIIFTGGGELEVSATASSGATSILGTLSVGAVADNEDGDVGITAKISRGRTIKFTDDSLVVLSETAEKNATSLVSATVNYGGTIGEIKYGGLRTPTTGGTLAAGAVGTVGYVVGDMVRVKPQMPTGFTKPEDGAVNPGVSLDRFFICIKDHYTAQDPRYKSEYWREDQCGKTLFSCRLRYEEFAESNGLPFGGFPSIEAYRYTN